LKEAVTVELAHNVARTDSVVVIESLPELAVVRFVVIGVGINNLETSLKVGHFQGVGYIVARVVGIVVLTVMKADVEALISYAVVVAALSKQITCLMRSL